MRHSWTCSIGCYEFGFRISALLVCLIYLVHYTIKYLTQQLFYCVLYSLIPFTLLLLYHILVSLYIYSPSAEMLRVGSTQ